MLTVIAKDTALDVGEIELSGHVVMLSLQDLTTPAGCVGVEMLLGLCSLRNVLNI
jgi:hypothetical protein